MSFNSDGFVVDTYSNIMDRIYNAFVNVLPDLEFTPDNLITHWQEILAYEQRLTQVMLADAINNFSVLSSTGIFLVRQGLEAGIIQKGSLSSTGDLNINGWCDSANIINSGSVFSTSDGRNYISTESLNYPDSVEITRSDSHEDDLPSPYKNATIDGLYTDGSLNTGISTDYYSISGDVIVWNANGMAHGVSEGVLYYADVSGLIDLIIPVVSESAGASYNVSANRINVDSNGFGFVDHLTNESPLYNGKDIESDVDYRHRILKARRKTFSLGRIESLCENLRGVRDVRAYQVTNTDKNSIGLAWDINNLTGFTGNVFAPSGEWFGFSFRPSDDVATIKEFKLYGRTSGMITPRTIPKLEYYLKPHYAGAYLTDTGYYLQKGYIEKFDLNRDEFEIFQEITPILKYNGIDNAKTYQIYLRESGFIHVHSGHWEFAYSGIAISSGYDNETYLEGIGLDDKQILSRTMFGSPAYNIDVVVEDGYRFDPEIKDKIDKILNYEIYGGNSPVCIQYDIRKAVKTYLSLSVYLFILAENTFSDVVSNVKVSVGSYLRTIKSGEKIYYTMVEKAILDAGGIVKLKDMRIKLNNGDWVDRTTQNDLGLSDKEYIDLDLNTLYDGIAIYEG